MRKARVGGVIGGLTGVLAGLLLIVGFQSVQANMIPTSTCEEDSVATCDVPKLFDAFGR